MTKIIVLKKVDVTYSKHVLFREPCFIPSILPSRSGYVYDIPRSFFCCLKQRKGKLNAQN